MKATGKLSLQRRDDLIFGPTSQTREEFAIAGEEIERSQTT
jgi:hypothetical protein